jgi:hypothetical protein
MDKIPEMLPSVAELSSDRQMFRNIEMEDLASTVFDDEETIQNPEG